MAKANWQEEELHEAMKTIHNGLQDGSLNIKQISTFVKDVLWSVEVGKRFCTAKTETVQTNVGAVEFIIDSNP